MSVHLSNKMEQICIKTARGYHSINKDTMCCSKKYMDRYYNQKDVELKEESNPSFSGFVKYLNEGILPNSETEQLSIYYLLVEWKFHHFILENYVNKMAFLTNDFVIRFKKKMYNTNISRMSMHCSVIRNYIDLYPGYIFEVKFKCSEEVFIEFLDLLNGKVSVNDISSYGEVYRLCEFLECRLMCMFFDQKRLLLYELTNNSDSSMLTFFNVEKIIGKDIKSYLNPDLAKLPLPFLIRVFQECTIEFSISEIKPFLEGLVQQRPLTYQMILNNIMFKNMIPSDMKEAEDLFSSKTNINKILISTMNTYKEEIKKFIDNENNIQNGRKKSKKKLETEIEKWKKEEKSDFVLPDILQAAYFGHLFSVVFLLHQGSDVNTRDDTKDGWHIKGFRPIHYAAKYNHLKVLDYLVNNGANIDIVDDELFF